MLASAGRVKTFLEDLHHLHILQVQAKGSHCCSYTLAISAECRFLGAWYQYLAQVLCSSYNLQFMSLFL